MPEIYLHLNGEQVGPYSPDQLQKLLAEGKITGETPAWHESLADWSTLDQVVEHISSGGKTPPPPPPLASSSYVPPPVDATPSAKKGMSGGVIAAIVVGAISVLLIPCCAGVALGPIMNGIHKAKENTAIQVSRLIGISMATYASDHNGAYPDGKTSTEVFQKLLDEKYITDPGVFYLEMDGKTKATGKQLAAENVCYDVTGGVTADSPDGLPVVFCTGYTVTYKAGASATRDSSTSTPFVGTLKGASGLAVTYKGNNCRFLDGDADGNVPAFIPQDFVPAGKEYRQLRP